MSDRKLQVVPLGGLGEFGMNIMALRYGDDIIVIDCGMMFPEAELLGVDIVTPDLTYLVENREHVRALFLTHAHEDHIGAVPYFLAEFDVPIYGAPFTLALVERRLEEHELEQGPKLRTVKPLQIVEAGPFRVEFIHVTHSVVDCLALAITTPLGVVIHTGDFKIDPTPLDNDPFDLHTLADYGKRGVLLLLSDSTNVDRPGYTESERAVRPRMEDVFNRAERRVIVSCFSSSVHRLQMILDISGPQHDQRHGNRAFAGSADRSRWGAHPHAGCDAGGAAQTHRADFRDAGRADVGALARGRGQPQARFGRERGHSGAQLAHHPGQ